MIVINVGSNAVLHQVLLNLPFEGMSVIYSIYSIAFLFVYSNSVAKEIAEDLPLLRLSFFVHKGDSFIGAAQSGCLGV